MTFQLKCCSDVFVKVAFSVVLLPWGAVYSQDGEIAERDQLIAQKDASIVQKDAEIAVLSERLRGLEQLLDKEQRHRADSLEQVQRLIAEKKEQAEMMAAGQAELRRISEQLQDKSREYEEQLRSSAIQPENARVRIRKRQNGNSQRVEGKASIDADPGTSAWLVLRMPATLETSVRIGGTTLPAHGPRVRLIRIPLGRQDGQVELSINGQPAQQIPINVNEISQIDVAHLMTAPN